MFQVDVQAKSGRAGVFTHVVYVDTLYEAELLALSLAAQHNSVGQVMLVHRGDLIYDIYEIKNPIGEVRIKLK